VITPRFGRLSMWSLAAAGINDFLQASFAALTHKANELELRTSARWQSRRRGRLALARESRSRDDAVISKELTRP
jgi:hypothetical protein